MNDIHPSFQFFISRKEKEFEELYSELRNFIYEVTPEVNELLYHTHALTSVYSVSKKLSHAFCHIPVYSNHLNLGFNRGTLLDDPDDLLQGTGKFIRHIPIRHVDDFHLESVVQLIKAAHTLALEDLGQPQQVKNETISKIKM